MYPKKIQLKKIYTLPNAEDPQPIRYPNGTTREGLMWEHTKPKVGERFHVMQSEFYFRFITSEVTKIITNTPERIVFDTINSKYELTIIS